MLLSNVKTEYNNTKVSVQSILNGKSREDGVRDFFQDLSNQLGGKLPSNLTAEQSATLVIGAVTAYVNALDNQTSAAYSEDDLRNHIAENIRDKTMEEAKVYLAWLTITYNHMDANRNAGVSANALQAEHKALVASYADKHPQEIIDNLVDGLDFSKVRTSTEVCKQFVDEHYTEGATSINTYHQSIDERLVEVLTQYTFAAKGEVEGIDPSVDPGTFAATCCTQTDTQRVSEMPKEQAEVELGKIGNAFVIATAVALNLLYAFVAHQGTMLAAMLAAFLGLPGWLVSIAALGALIFFIDFYYNKDLAETSLTVAETITIKGKVLWDKACSKVNALKQAWQAKRALKAAARQHA